MLEPDNSNHIMDKNLVLPSCHMGQMEYTGKQFNELFGHIQYYLMVDDTNMTHEGIRVEQSEIFDDFQNIYFYPDKLLGSKIHYGRQKSLSMKYIYKVTFLESSNITVNKQSGIYRTTSLKVHDKSHIWDNYDICKFMMTEWSNVKYMMQFNTTLTTEQKFELTKIAVMQNYNALEFVKNVFSKDKYNELLTLAKIKKPSALQAYALYEDQTPEMWNKIISSNGTMIKHVKGKFLTYDLCMLAIKQNINAFGVVPECFQDENMCMYAIKKRPEKFKYVRDDLKTIKLCKLTLEMDFDIEVPNKYQYFQIITHKKKHVYHISDDIDEHVENELTFDILDNLYKKRKNMIVNDKHECDDSSFKKQCLFISDSNST